MERAYPGRIRDQLRHAPLQAPGTDIGRGQRPGGNEELDPGYERFKRRGQTYWTALRAAWRGSGEQPFLYDNVWVRASLNLQLNRHGHCIDLQTSFA